MEWSKYILLDQLMQLEDDHKLSGTPSFLGSKEASYLKSLCALKSVYFFFSQLF